MPLFLLEDVGGPVLCTQPRRLAVVSIAQRVAEERGVLLGGDEVRLWTGQESSAACIPQHSHTLCPRIRFSAMPRLLLDRPRSLRCMAAWQVGYRIGQRPHYSVRTQIVFATAGVLLEDLKGAACPVERGPARLGRLRHFCYTGPTAHSRTTHVPPAPHAPACPAAGQGASALTRYKVVILDEVHERSVESDLVLACIRELMRVAAYSDYFKPVSEGRLARIQVTYPQCRGRECKGTCPLER